MSPALAGRFFTSEPPGKSLLVYSSVKEAHLESLIHRLLRELIELKHKDKAVRTIPGMY